MPGVIDAQIDWGNGMEHVSNIARTQVKEVVQLIQLPDESQPRDLPVKRVLTDVIKDHSPSSETSNTFRWEEERARKLVSLILPSANAR